MYENQVLNGTWTPSFYGYDGHGSVRQLTNAAGVVTDSYDYDAFGNLSNSTGSTPNNYLFAGEQFDPALALYYNRARYLNTATGRFWGMDTDEGDPGAPASLHKYLYAGSDPVNHRDPPGNDFDLGSTLAASAGGTTIFGMSVIQSAIVIQGVTGALFASSLAGFGAALEGQSPNQIEGATGNMLNITLGALTAIGGSVAVASKLGAYALAMVSLGAGGWKAYNEYQQGNFAAAVYYGALGALGGILSAAVPYLRGSTQTPPAVVLKGPNPNVVPGNPRNSSCSRRLRQTQVKSSWEKWETRRGWRPTTAAGNGRRRSGCTTARAVRTPKRSLEVPSAVQGDRITRSITLST